MGYWRYCCLSATIHDPYLRGPRGLRLTESLQVAPARARGPQQQHAQALDLPGVICVMAIGIVGSLVVWITPGLLALCAQQAGLEDRHLGYTAAWEINMMAATIGLSTFLIPRFPWRAVVGFGLSLICLGNLAAGLSHGFEAIVGARATAGAGEGIAIGYAFAALGRARNPDRVFAIYLFGGGIISSAILLSLPVLQQRAGAANIFIANALITGVVALGLIRFPRGDSHVQSTQRVGAGIDWRLASAALVAVFIYFAAQNALWSYAERIGQASGVGSTQIARALASATIAGIGGSLLAALLPRRLGRAWPLTLSSAVSILSFCLLLGQVPAPMFLLSMMLLMGAWCFSQPLLSGLCCEADPQGRVVCAMACIQTFGAGFGPAAAAVTLHDHDFSLAVLSGIALLAGSHLIILLGISGRSHGLESA